MYAEGRRRKFTYTQGHQKGTLASLVLLVCVCNPFNDLSYSADATGKGESGCKGTHFSETTKTFPQLFSKIKQLFRDC